MLFTVAIAQTNTTLNDKFARLLILVAGLVATGDVAPDIFRLAGTARLAAFATAVRMVNRVHSFAANGRTDTGPARASGFAECNEVPLRVRNLTKRRHRIPLDAPHF